MKRTVGINTLEYIQIMKDLSENHGGVVQFNTKKRTIRLLKPNEMSKTFKLLFRKTPSLKNEKAA